MREINYTDVLRSIDEALNAMEFGAQRSAGKCKQAVHDINALLQYREYVTKQIKPAKAPVKKEG